MTLRFSVFCAAFCLLGVSVPATAGGFDDAEQAMIQANTEYFNAEVSGQASTPEQKAALYNQTVGNVYQKMDQEIVNRWYNAFRMRSGASQAAVGPDPVAWDQVRAQITGKKSRSFANSGTLAPAMNGEAADAAPPQAPKPGIALDGSKIQHLIEFPAKREPASLPDPGASDAVLGINGK